MPPLVMSTKYCVNLYLAINHSLLGFCLKSHPFEFCLLFRAFGGASNLRIPHWGGVNGCLLEYLPLIQELFSQKVKVHDTIYYKQCLGCNLTAVKMSATSCKAPLYLEAELFFFSLVWPGI